MAVTGVKFGRWGTSRVSTATNMKIAIIIFFLLITNDTIKHIFFITHKVIDKKLIRNH